MGLNLAFAKYVLFFSNLLFVILGTILLVFGGIMERLHYNYTVLAAGSPEEAATADYRYLPNMLLIGGAIIFVVSFFGCWGTLKLNHCMIITFSGILLLVVILEIIGFAAIYFYYDYVKAMINYIMLGSIRYYSVDYQTKKTWDILHYTFKCCGINGTADWDTYTIPPSCCPDLVEGTKCEAASSYQEGCFPTIQELIYQNALVLFISSLILIGIQINGVTFACILAEAIRKGYNV